MTFLRSKKNTYSIDRPKLLLIDAEGKFRIVGSNNALAREPPLEPFWEIIPHTPN